MQYLEIYEGLIFLPEVHGQGPQESTFRHASIPALKKKTGKRMT